MSESDLTPNDVIFLISQNQLRRSMLAAALTLATYDTILTFSKEIKGIWQRKFGTGTILYLLIRYATLVDLLFQILAAFNVVKTVNGCKSISILTYFADFSCLLSYASFNCIRVWSICQHAWIPTMVVFLLSMFNPAINLYGNKEVFFQEYIVVLSGPLAGCWSTVADSPYIYILLIMNVISVVLDAFSIATAETFSSFIYIQDIITAILLSHFILDLRFVDHKSNDYTESNPSTLHFASVAEGNPRSTLNTSGAENDSDGLERFEEVELREMA
ncbi:hypothetical protein QCA50_008227 [Cerrena zonata]|uniref:DUF6533 domain-containing protein n=1 Tax=Cerrena zonata TaxID=2478898 RepID=A0AAW0GFH6_9APHY